MSKQLPDLSGFHGSETFTRFNAFNRTALATEGAIHLAEQVGAYWLLDEIALAQTHPKIRGEEFQVWKLTVKDAKGTLAVEDGNDNVVRTKRIPYTDFPEPGFTLWAARNELGGVTVMLPSEY